MNRCESGRQGNTLSDEQTQPSSPEEVRAVGERVEKGPALILEVGCGGNKYPAAIGIDYNPDTAAHLLCNLDGVSCSRI